MCQLNFVAMLYLYRVIHNVLLEKMNMMFFLLVTQAYSDKVKKNSSAPNRSRTYDLPISTSDALPLSYRRLVVARPLN